MTEPLTGLAAVLFSVGLGTAVTGSLADYVGLAFTVADHLKAQDGLVYEPCVFALEPPAGEAPGGGSPALPSKSAASRVQDPTAPPRSASTPVSLPTRTSVTFADVLEIRSGHNVLVFRWVISLIEPSNVEVFASSLYRRRGFDTPIGDQAGVTFAGEPVPGGRYVTIRGWVNKWLSGYCTFEADLLVPYGPPRAGAGRPAYRPQVLRSAGTGDARRFAANDKGALVLEV